MASGKKVLVIGGGFSGIGSIKSLKEEGYDPICYEKTSNAGGTWYYREQTPMGIPSIMPTTIINHSKEMGALTNFPPNKNYPNYMRHFELLNLFKDVGNHFDCFKHITYNREVIRVARSSDYEETGRWDVTVKNTETGEIMEQVFDAVMIGVGHITYPKMATYPGMDKYQGVIMHTHSLKDVEKFKGKRVVVVGIGCSGLDAASEISGVAAQITKMNEKKRIAIIGGGFSGLSSIRALKEENMEPVCYERTANPGGTWCYREEAPEGVPSIMSTTIINHSKEMGALSNFPPSKTSANYMRHSECYEYFKQIGEAYDVFKHMIFNREVIGVEKNEDFDITGRWIVTVKNTKNGEISSDVFDGVMICTGHITFPKMYDFPGMDKFRGKILHTHSLKRVGEFAGQRICVIGIGCSALDAAVETSNVAQQVYLSTRSGSWIFPRVGPSGVPMDYALLRRCITYFQEILPISLSSKFIEKFFLSSKLNHDLYNLRPQYHVLCKDPSVNDVLPSKLMTGSVVLKKNVKHFTEKGVVFEGEDTVTEVDTVIMATGYQWKFPFLKDDDVLTTEKDGRVNLYKCMWSPNLKHQTIVFIGFVLPFGPGFPLGEIQCRWVAQVFRGKLKLPSKEVMMKEVIKRHQDNVNRYRPGDKMSIRVDFIPYMDDIASQFGAKPNLLKLLITDPVLFKELVFGPSVPYQYRLQGPHPWKGARKAILGVKERMKAPLLQNPPLKKKKTRLDFIVKYIINMLLITLWISWKDSTMKYYFAAMLLPHYMSWRSFPLKYIVATLILPFFIVWNGFLSSYFATLLIPLVIATVSSI